MISLPIFGVNYPHRLFSIKFGLFDRHNSRANTRYHNLYALLTSFLSFMPVFFSIFDT